MYSIFTFLMFMLFGMLTFCILTLIYLIIYWIKGVREL